MAMYGDTRASNVDEYNTIDLASGFDLIWSFVDYITNGISDCKVDFNDTSLYVNVNKECIGLASVGILGVDA